MAVEQVVGSSYLVLGGLVEDQKGDQRPREQKTKDQKGERQRYFLRLKTLFNKPNAKRAEDQRPKRKEATIFSTV